MDDDKVRKPLYKKWWFGITLAIMATLLVQFSVPSSSGYYNINANTDSYQVSGLSLVKGVGIKVYNQSTGLDSLIVKTSNSSVFKAVSPKGDKLALAYQTSDSLNVAIITLNPFKMNLMSTSKNTQSQLVSMKWKDNSSVAWNYMIQKKENDKFLYQNTGSYFVNTDSMKLNYLKFNNGYAIVAWLPSGYLVTQYDKSRYIIDLKSGKTLFTLSDLTKLTFSPDGKKCFYFQNQIVTSDDGREYNIPELFMADYNGKNPQKIANYKNKPQNPEWSPDSKTIVFDIQSPDWTNIRYLAFCDAQTAKTSFEKNDEVSRTEPRFSPSGRRLFFYEKDIPVMNQPVSVRATVRNLSDQTNKTIRRGIVGDLERQVGINASWFEDDFLKLEDNYWVKIYNVETLTETTFNRSSITDIPIIHLWKIN